MNVHVIDDDDAVRDAMCLGLRARGLTVREYGSARHFRERLETAPPGCIITDVVMPEMTGLELLRLLAPRRHEFPIIVLTGRANVAMAVDALKGGAVDFLEKPAHLETLYSAVASAMQGMADSNQRHLEVAASRRSLAALSSREREVLDGLVKGWSNKMIAREFDLSPRTVEAYRANLMTKMQARSVPELMRKVLLAEL